LKVKKRKWQNKISFIKSGAEIFQHRSYFAHTRKKVHNE